MLACKHCSTPNSLDSTFCKKCGTAVPADEKREAYAQLERLVSEGLIALNAGRTAEALAIAESAVQSDPTHLGALNLKSATHERRGEIAEALESAERIVELNPDSELDRIKRNGLRTALLNSTQPTTIDRRLTLTVAVSVAALVLCAGVYAVRRSSAPVPVASNDQPHLIVEPPVAANVNPAQNVSMPTTQTAPNTNNVPPVSTPRGDISLPRDPGMTALPSPEEGNGPLQVDRIPPYESPKQNPPEGQPTNPPKKKGDDPDPVTLPGPIAKTDPEDDPGQIEISVSGGSKKFGGSVPIGESRTNGSVAYARVGEERFGLGDYAGAATNYEKAISGGGGDAVQLNLRLAQSYSRLGRNSEAATAYERCKSAAENALASGRGNRERLQAARDAAEAGLRVARGG